MNKFLTVAFMFVALTIFATDTAFWKPYKNDKNVFFFENFDFGNVPGRFGKAWDGTRQFQAKEAKLYLNSSITMEAWVKLDKVPAKRAYIVERPYKLGKTNGMDFFINPNLSFGAEIRHCVGNNSIISSKPNTVSLNKWVHLAVVSAGSRYMMLYLNGHEIKRVQLGSSKGLGRRKGRRKKESLPVAIRIGGGLPGLLDEVRIHPEVRKLWPKPDNSWTKNTKKIPPVKQLLTPASKVVLYCSFDGSKKPDIKQPKLKYRGEGKFVDGVRGKAYRGTYKLSGNIVSAPKGSLEFWSRPIGINNYSDRNRRIVTNTFFTFYILNATKTLRPLCLYYRTQDKKLVFGINKLTTDIYPGKWYHYVFRWDKNTVDYYIDGQKAGGVKADFAKDMMKQLSFNTFSLFGDIDELYVYNNKLSETEVMNTYYRYTNPGKVQKKPKGKVAYLQFWHMPGKRHLYIKVKSLNPSFAKSKAKVLIINPAGEKIFSADIKTSDQYQKFILPKIPSGNYLIFLKSKAGETKKQKFRNQRFPWENNKLGITDKVYPPFTPVKTNANTVSVVQRKYRMNAFGLWDKISSKGKELLAKPITLVAIAENGKVLEWQCSLKRAGNAVYKATSKCLAIKIDTTAKIECDGMMRLTMKLHKVNNPVKLKSLYIDIPLKASIVKLMHEDAVSHRRNFSGKLSMKQGEIWNSVKSMRGPEWQNAFTGYVWMGGPERGLAWFAANDKGWYTQKNRKATIMNIIRRGDTVSLRIYLVNKPTLINKTSELTFGLQASPTRPIPKDFRTKGILLQDVGLSVHPWGGLSCSWKYPWREQWEVVDKIAASRNGGKADKAFFEKFQKTYKVPKVHGTRDWVKDCLYFSGKKSSIKRSDFTYFEEMYALTPVPEWYTFMDEWSSSRLVEKSYPTMAIYKKNIVVNPHARINYAKSYIDYGLYYMNEWMKRGISPYWDNCYLKLLTNPWTSDAYICKNGTLQPASSIWRQREYMKRTWNLLNYWRKHQDIRPLDFVAHMTNTNLIPLFSWSTINYDIEMNQSIYANNFDMYETGEPYMPEFLLAESTGRQVGAYPYLVHNIFLKQSNLPYEALGPVSAEIEAPRREWGMRMVHEIIRGGPQCGSITISLLEKAVYEFGYGTDKVKVWNYWGDDKAFKVNPDKVKALLLTRASDEKMLLVLQSWNQKPVSVTAEFFPKVIGFKPGKYVYGALNNRQPKLDGNVLRVNYQFPYATGIYIISNSKSIGNVLFEDNFNAGLNPGWSYVSHYLKIKDGALHFDRNTASWRGPSRVFKTFDLPVYDDAILSFDYQLGKIPANTAEVMTVCFPGEGLKMSRHGLSHSNVSSGVNLRIGAYPGKGLRLMVSTNKGGKCRQLAWKYVDVLDTQKHKIKITYNALEYTIYFDAQEVLKVKLPRQLQANSFSFSANPRNKLVKQIRFIKLDNIMLKAEKADYSMIKLQHKKAITAAHSFLQAQDNKFKKDVLTAFGVRKGSDIYKLSFFRNPVLDTKELCQILKITSSSNQKTVLIKMLKQLEIRKQEYIKAMQAIGQPLDQVPEFKKAQKEARKHLK